MSAAEQPADSSSHMTEERVAYWEVMAISARARGDNACERIALDQLALIERRIRELTNANRPTLYNRHGRNDGTPEFTRDYETETELDRLRAPSAPHDQDSLACVIDPRMAPDGKPTLTALAVAGRVLSSAWLAEHDRTVEIAVVKDAFEDFVVYIQSKLDMDACEGVSPQNEDDYDDLVRPILARCEDLTREWFS